MQYNCLRTTPSHLRVIASPLLIMVIGIITLYPLHRADIQFSARRCSLRSLLRRPSHSNSKCKSVDAFNRPTTAIVQWTMNDVHATLVARSSQKRCNMRWTLQLFGCLQNVRRWRIKALIFGTVHENSTRIDIVDWRRTCLEEPNNPTQDRTRWNQNKWALTATPSKYNASLYYDVDLWLLTLKSCQQCPLTWWVFVARDRVTRIVLTDGQRPDDRKTHCLRRLLLAEA